MNPLYNTNDSPNGATQPTKAVNREAVHVPNTHNTFDMSYFKQYLRKNFHISPQLTIHKILRSRLP